MTVLNLVDDVKAGEAVVEAVCAGESLAWMCDHLDVEPEREVES